ncbi:monocarboxylate transporter 12-like [Asterias amurensis]|uniref:monocarboxylate transporter 12-like n=1 Tax=Asterias amurensis TaxID=7602 RepID=UPI003AB2EAE7
MTSAEIRRGWCAVLCLHVTTFLWVGNIKGLGVMLPTLTEQFTAQTWLMGWMVSIVAGVVCLTGPLASPLESIFGTRAVIMASGFAIGASFIAASFATNVAQITIVLALGCGSGLSFTNILSRAMMGRCFTSNYAIAVGIGHAGSPLGLIIMAPLVQVFLDTYGWRGTMLLMGGINLNIAVCGALLSQPSKESHEVKYTPVPSTVDECNTKPRGVCLKETLMTIKNRSGILVCSKLSFWIPTFIFIFNGTTGVLWFAYFIDHVLAKGFTAYDAVLFTTVGGLSNVVIKILSGPIIDRRILSVRVALVIYILASSACLLVDPWMNSYWLMMVNVFIFYGSLGTVGALVDILTRELLGPELLASAFSWMKFVSGIAFFCFGFFPGWIYDTVGSYDVAFVIMGLTPALSLVALLVERLRPTDKSN